MATSITPASGTTSLEPGTGGTTNYGYVTPNVDLTQYLNQLGLGGQQGSIQNLLGNQQSAAGLPGYIQSAMGNYPTTLQYTPQDSATANNIFASIMGMVGPSLAAQLPGIAQGQGVVPSPNSQAFQAAIAPEVYNAATAATMAPVTTEQGKAAADQSLQNWLAQMWGTGQQNTWAADQSLLQGLITNNAYQPVQVPAGTSGGTTMLPEMTWSGMQSGQGQGQGTGQPATGAANAQPAPINPAQPQTSYMASKVGDQLAQGNSPQASYGSYTPYFGGGGYGSSGGIQG